ncbi:hypothetical protein BCR32DRAFT_280732 [Anaeromyces robustus]|uniref:Uncharacterized protein n=1 Tax=Anaeromyces robustus TaxID=1754192 RepID=A0A1Y1X3I8_9FUNG|nr:hypothetical protein BCR32DRAFT_280732 [Anaeromyces robustus]|eukprot:ORX80198.1 hypothetical protein BCR32DRAFT_280732 [Anaeromyces robustus]
MKPVDMSKELKKEDKKKNSKEEKLDKKLDDYVKQYQINNYKPEYEYLIKNKVRSYSRIKISKFALKTLCRIYLCLYKTEAPNVLVSERAEYELDEAERFAIRCDLLFDSDFGYHLLFLELLTTKH